MLVLLVFGVPILRQTALGGSCGHHGAFWVPTIGGHHGGDL